MAEQKKISKRDAQIECIELDENYVRGNLSKIQKFKSLFKLPRRNIRSR